MTLSVPLQPVVPAEQQDRTELRLRHEDLTQDGRVQVSSLLWGVTATVWERLLALHPMSQAMREQGVLPVATRLTAEGHGGPFGVVRPFTVTGAYQLAHAVDQGGDVERIVLKTRADLHGPIGHFHAPPPPASLLALPAGAVPLEAELAPDSGPTAFGLCHTDANQHVTVLNYPQLFEEAALRRFAALGKSTKLLARFMDVGYRKPSMAGDTLRIVLQTFTLGERLGAVGAFLTEEEARLGMAAAQPRCFVRMLFES